MVATPEGPLPGAGPSRSPRGRTPFVGREPELAALLEGLEAAGRGEGNVVLVAGEAGIGKSRLLREFVDRARAAGWRVLSGRAYATEGMPPYLPFVEAFREYLRAGSGEDVPAIPDDLPEVASLLPEMRGRLPTLPVRERPSPESERYRLFEGISDFLLRVAGFSQWPGLLLCLDDLHWADKSTLLLFHHLARKLPGAPLLVVGAYRTTELDATHPLSDVLAELSRERLCQRLPLDSLSREEAVTLIARAGGVTPSPEVCEAIYRETDGNPFFLEEIVRHFQAEGRDLADPRPDVAGWGVPEEVRQAVGRRLGRLGPDVSRALQAAAVLGDGFRFELLRAMVDMDAAALTAALEEAGRAGMVRDEGDVYRFGHPLILETANQEMSPRRRRLLHVAAAEAMETVYRASLDAHLEALATHCRLAGDAADPEKAADYAWRAAGAAEGTLAWEIALRHYEWCQSLLHERPGQSTLDEAAVLTAKGRCHLYSGSFRDSWADLTHAAAIFRERADWAGSAGATLLAIRNWPSPARQLEVIDRALEAPGTPDNRLEAQLLVGRARIWGRDRELALTETEDPADVRAQLTLFYAEVAVGETRWLDAAPLYREAASQFEALGDMEKAARTLFDWAACFCYAGLISQTEANHAEVVEYARRLRNPTMAISLQVLATLALFRADFARARYLLDQAPQDRARAVGLFMYAHSIRIRLAELQGDLDEAEKLLSELVPYSAAPLDQMIIYGTRSRVLLEVGKGQAALDELQVLAASVLESLKGEAHPIIRWNAPYAGRSLVELGDEGLVRAVYDHYRAIPEYRVYFLGSADELRGSLALRLGLVEEAEQWYTRGLDWARQERCPVPEGQCLQGLAEVALRQRRRREALRLLEQAAAIFEGYGVKLYLDQVLARKALLHGSGAAPATPAYPDNLTQREVEVLRLIAAGGSNQEMAAALVLSVRTVERHITNIYGKINARSKAEATAYAFRHSLASPP